MNEQNFIHVTPPTRPLHQIKTPPLTEEAKEVILRHGCRLEEHLNECIVSFPEGTTRTEIFLRTMNPRYQIKLPDGYELREVYDRYRGEKTGMSSPNQCTPPMKLRDAWLRELFMKDMRDLSYSE